MYYLMFAAVLSDSKNTKHTVLLLAWFGMFSKSYESYTTSFFKLFLHFVMEEGIFVGMQYQAAKHEIERREPRRDRLMWKSIQKNTLF